MKVLLNSLLSVLILLTFSCKKTDVVTQASNQSFDHFKLPVEKGEYTLLGHIPGIHNFVVKYDENLYRGGKIDSQAVSNIFKQWGIKTIVSLTFTEQEKNMAQDMNIKLVQLEMGKKEGVTPRLWSEYSNTLVTEDFPMYVHCYGGVNRAGILALIYRIEYLDWSYEQALTEYIVLGGKSYSNNLYLKTLREYIGTK